MYNINHLSQEQQAIAKNFIKQIDESSDLFNDITQDFTNQSDDLFQIIEIRRSLTNLSDKLVELRNILENRLT